MRYEDALRSAGGARYPVRRESDHGRSENAFDGAASHRLPGTAAMELRAAPLRVAAIGLGVYGQMVARLMLDKGLELVAAVDRRAERAGRDVGSVLGLDAPIGLAIHAGGDEAIATLFAESRPDVCVVCTRTRLADVADTVAEVLRTGTHCLTLCEEAFFPHDLSTEPAASLDRLGKAHRCTLSGVGFQDTIFGWMAVVLGASSHRIDHIRVVLQYDADGPRLAESHGIGLDLASFEPVVAASETQFYTAPVAEWLCAAFGWTVADVRTGIAPVLSERAVHWPFCGLEITPGRATGMAATSLATTHEGPTVECHCVGKVYDATDRDFVECTLRGVPGMTLRIDQPALLEMTASSLVNRIPDVITAPAGLVTTNRLPAPRHWDGRPLAR